MDKKTPEDFFVSYMNIGTGSNRNDDESSYPKLINWVVESPLIYNSLQVNVIVLQRQMTPDDDWKFYATIKMNDHTLGTDETIYETDRYADEGTIELPVADTFEEAIDLVYAELDEVIERYYT